MVCREAQTCSSVSSLRALGSFPGKYTSDEEKPCSVKQGQNEGNLSSGKGESPAPRVLQHKISNLVVRTPGFGFGRLLMAQGLRLPGLRCLHLENGPASLGHYEN